MKDTEEFIEELLESATKTEYQRTLLEAKPLNKDTSNQLNVHKHEACAFERRDENGYWHPIPDHPYTKFRGGQAIWGYKRDDRFPGFLVPIPEQLEKLEEAKQYVKQYSFDTVARWLSAVTGRRIGYNELYDRINHGWDRDKRAAVLRRWAVRFKKAILAAQKIEETSADAGELKSYTEEGVIDLRKKAAYQPVTGQPRILPEQFDDGTPSEAERPPKKTHAGKPRRPGPRRPRRSRAEFRDRLPNKL